MTQEEISATYPEYTVYVYYDNKEQVSVKSWNHYAELGKTYQECSAALAKSSDFHERQDKDLYYLARNIERKRDPEVDMEEFVGRLRNISFDIAALLERLRVEE